jgi:hypothetical protein
MVIGPLLLGIGVGLLAGQLLIWIIIGLGAGLTLRSVASELGKGARQRVRWRRSAGGGQCQPLARDEHRAAMRGHQTRDERPGVALWVDPAGELPERVARLDDVDRPRRPRPFGGGEGTTSERRQERADSEEQSGDDAGRHEGGDGAPPAVDGWPRPTSGDRRKARSGADDHEALPLRRRRLSDGNH